MKIWFGPTMGTTMRALMARSSTAASSSSRLSGASASPRRPVVFRSPRRLDRAFTGPTSTRRRRANALPGELGVLADAEGASELARQAAEGADALAGATERVNGPEQIVLSVLTTLAFALLFVLTAGVGYLSYKSWQDDKNAKSESAGLQSSLNLGAKGAKPGDGKPTLSKVGKGFAKGSGRSSSRGSGTGSRATRSAGKGKDLEDLKRQAEGALTLPSGWAQYEDEESGDPYFYNEETKKTQWERPE